MATWIGTDGPQAVYTVDGRQYHVYKVIGSDVDMGDTFEIDPVAHGLQQVSTMSFFGVTGDGVATFQPIVSNASADGGDLTTESAAVLIRNQSPAVLLLDNGPITVDVNANADNLAPAITIVFAVGQDVRGA